MFTKNVFKQKDPVAEAISKIAEQDYEKKLTKLKEQQEEVAEGWDDMLKSVKDKAGPQPSGGSGVKKGSRYGGSAQKDKPEQDDDKKKVKNEETDSLVEAGVNGRPGTTPGFKDSLDAEEKRRAQRAADRKAEYMSTKTGIDKSRAKADAYRNKEVAEKIEPEVKSNDTLTGPKSGAASNKFRQSKVKFVPEEVEDAEAEALVENIEIINEVSLGAKIKAYAHHEVNAFDSADYGDQDDADRHAASADRIKANILKHHGPAAVAHAEKHAHSRIFGNGKPHAGDDRLKGGLRNNTNVTKSGKIPKGTQKAMKNKIMAYGRHRDISGPKGHLPEEVESMEERHLSPGEKKEVEKNVKGMKKNLAGFKARYGDRAKSVMYATSTKAAKKD